MAKIKRFGVLNTAYFMGIFGVFIGFIYALIWMVFSLIFSSLVSNTEGTTLAWGWWSLILFPIGYGVLMFLSGLVFTPIMNLILKMIGGLEWDISMK